MRMRCNLVGETKLSHCESVTSILVLPGSSFTIMFVNYDFVVYALFIDFQVAAVNILPATWYGVAGLGEGTVALYWRRDGHSSTVTVF